MNQLLKYLAYSIGAFVLFTGSFLGFAAFSGTPMHELALVGRFFPEEKSLVDEPESEDPLVQVEQDARPAEQVIQEAALPLHAFLLDDAISAPELARLQSELKTLIRSNETRAAALDEREKDLDLRARHYEDRWAEMEAIRTNLMRSEIELEERRGEVARDEAAQAARENASWKSLAAIFAEGKAKSLTPRLIQYEPLNAAKILRALPEARAAELLQEVPPDRYVEYTEAYRKAQE